MPRIPRDISGQTLCKCLGKYGYIKTRQIGSHMRLTSHHMGKEHSITIPDHNPIKIGTLNKIISDVADYLQLEKSVLISDIKD
jgi:predicted RNA binding protein YcfA (HicA-like mRNA interferase family)